MKHRGVVFVVIESVPFSFSTQCSVLGAELFGYILRKWSNFN